MKKHLNKKNSVLSKENISRRREIRDLVRMAEEEGHVCSFPIKVKFRGKSYMNGDWGSTEIKGMGKNKYIEISLDEGRMKTKDGRDLCLMTFVHELAHAIVWGNNEKVENAKFLKYGDHGPDFGIVYAQLWSDLMGGNEV